MKGVKSANVSETTARLCKAFVLLVGLAVVACEAHSPPRYEDIVDQAMEAYNTGRPGKPLFRLVDATKPSGQDAQVKGFYDYPDYASEKDQLKDLYVDASNIYGVAKFDIINIIRKFLGLEKGG